MKAAMLRWGMSFSATLLCCGYASVAAATPVVISEFQTAGTSSASQEYVSIYNNSSVEVDISGWCLQYVTASGATTTNLACLPASAQTETVIPPQHYVTFATNEYVIATSIPSDYVFSAGLAATGGHLRLVDAQNPKQQIDKVGWGTAANPETSAITAPGPGERVERILMENVRVDTDNNFEDFGVDVCLNLSGMQKIVPVGYGADPDGLCALDVCTNIDGLQLTIPDNFITDGFICTEILEDAEIIITEVMPNVAGSDTGKEYIELYNPNNFEVQLKGYELSVGPAQSSRYTLLEQIMLPLTYLSFSDVITGITLPNTTASLRLTAPAGNVVSEAEPYVEPLDDHAWALINDVWQYTLQPTQAAPNILLIAAAPAAVGGGADSEPCPEGKFRNPETNRCKSLEGDTELTPCTAGQERNPETNRCRSVLGSTSALVPCSEGQERNPETNRCRAIASTASSLVPCTAGQERNPETNRCRNASSAIQSAATEKITDIPSTTSNRHTGLIIAGLTLAAVGYALYEWRYELKSLVARLPAPKLGRS